MVVTFPPSHSEDQCKTRERAISREIMMLHLHPLPPAVFLRKREVVMLFLTSELSKLGDGYFIE